MSDPRRRRRRPPPQGQFATGHRVPDNYLPEGVVPEGDVLDRVLLYDFVTEEAKVLPRHRAQLDRLRRWLNSSVPIGVWIGGVASHAPYAHNRNLSLLRAQNVARYLLRGVSPSRRVHRRVVIRHFGASPDRSASENNPFYRAVLVVVTRVQRPAPAPPPGPPARARAPVFDRFRIALEHEAGGAVILGGTRLQFLIDYDNAAEHSPGTKPARYVLYAGGVGADIPVPDAVGTAGEVVGGGLGLDNTLDWNTFTARRNMTPADFDGWGFWNNGGIEFGAGITWTSLSIWPTRYTGGRVHTIAPFSTPPGVTLAAHLMGGDFAFQTYIFGNDYMGPPLR